MYLDRSIIYLRVYREVRPFTFTFTLTPTKGERGNILQGNSWNEHVLYVLGPGFPISIRDFHILYIYMYT